MLPNNKILVIDDEENVCRGCQRILSEKGYSVKMALSGEKGLDCLKNNHYDVMLLDLKMPGLSGMEVL